MKLKAKNLLFIIFLLIFNQLGAQENLDTLMIIAAKNNPNLKAKFNKHLADLQKVPQVGSLPDPDISFGFFITPMELFGGKQTAQFQIMQMFPWFGTLKASKNEASAMALSSFELFRAEKEEIFYTIRTNYYQLFLNQKQAQVYDTTLMLLKSIEQILLSKLKTINSGSSSPVNTSNSGGNANSTAGKSSMGMTANNQQSKTQSSSSMSSAPMTGSSSSFSDLLRLQVEMKELEDNIASLNNQKQLLIIQINSNLNRKPNTEIPIPESLNIPEFNYQNLALFDSIKVNNPMITMTKTDIQAYQKRQIMNKKMGYPMIGVGLNYALINKSEMSTSKMNGKDMLMPMFTVKLPIYRNKYTATIKEAQYLENAANEQLSNTENMLYLTYSEYLFALKDAERKISLYQDIILLTQKNFDLLLVQYASSGADFDAVIRLHRQLLDYKLNISQSQVEKLSAIAGIQKLLSRN